MEGAAAKAPAPFLFSRSLTIGAMGLLGCVSRLCRLRCAIVTAGYLGRYGVR